MFKYLLFVTFTSSTGVLFYYLNQIQRHYFIDEVFHIPQTIRYCAGNLTDWDSKITTLPGLYLITSAVLGPLNLCNTTYIRSTNLFGTFANLYLTFNIIREINKNDKNIKWNDWTELVTAYNLTLFPPLYFWCFFYYTDVMSTNFVLLMLLLHLRKHFKSSAIVGLLATIVRQTNILWVVFLTMDRIVELLESQTNQTIPRKFFNSPMHLKLLWNTVIQQVQKGPITFSKFVYHIFTNIYPHLTIGLIFLTFLLWNKGIVVGDRSAHSPVIHIPQVLYYSLFVLLFSWPHMIVKLPKFIHSIRDNRCSTIFVIVTMSLIVHLNTLVHPYVLADNRHYVFYVWNKLIGKYFIFKYMLIPFECFAMYALIDNSTHLRFTTRIIYYVIVVINLVPQLLLEPRYFIVPYIIYRLNIKKPEKWQLIMESSTTIIINILQFFIFINKVFYWRDIPHPQRITW